MRVMQQDYPESWNGCIDRLAGTAILDVAGFEQSVAISPVELTGLYFPWLALLKQAAGANADRTLAALAGIPAGGKSTLAAMLAHVAQALLPPDELMIVGMDGWHFPNAVLDARTTRDEAGNTIPLRHRKGGPESYDIVSLRRALERLKDPTASISLPIYDRRLHEPRPAALPITPATRIVIVEGNYVLGGVDGVPDWDPVAALLNPKFFVECDPGVARERMLARHLRGGSTPKQAVARYVGNDRLNATIIESTAVHADWRIQIDPPALRKKINA